MNCRECVTLVTEHLEGTLPDGERAIFERHLELCPGCVAYVESIRVTATALHEHAPPEPPDPEVRAHLLTIYRAAKGS